MLLGGPFFFVVEIETDNFKDKSLVNTTISYFCL